jgi:DNA-binding NarL/FixJ family response regulator
MTMEQRELIGQGRAPRRVLVVDDHPSFRRSAKTLLTAEGFDVVAEAHDGASALAAAAEHAPEIVLLDIQLPDIDGFEVARRLRELQPNILIVLISSRERCQYGPMIEDCGACGFVSKDELSGALLESLLKCSA